MLMKIERNLKRLRGSYKKLCDIKKRTIGFKAVQRWYIRGWGVSKRVVCLILTMFILKLCLKAIR